jgi:hypothetical protein
MNPVDLTHVLRRPGRYWNVDGLPLLGMGTLWLLNGAAILLMESLEGYRKLASVPLTLCFMVAVFSLNYAVKELKQRITEPRTGAMRLREQPGWPAAIGAFAAAFSMAVVVVVVRNGISGGLERAIPSGLGLVIAAAYFYASHHYGIPSYSAAGLCALLSGLTLTVLQVGFPMSLGWFFLRVGTASILCGAGDLRRFLRENPLRPGEETAQ